MCHHFPADSVRRSYRSQMTQMAPTWASCTSMGHRAWGVYKHPVARTAAVSTLSMSAFNDYCIVCETLLSTSAIYCLDACKRADEHPDLSTHYLIDLPLLAPLSPESYASGSRGSVSHMDLNYLFVPRGELWVPDVSGSVDSAVSATSNYRKWCAGVSH